TILDHVTREGNEYFKFMLANKGKPIISSEWFSIIEKIRANTLKESILELLHPNPSGRIQVYTEKEIYFELASKNYLSELQVFECKAKIDRLIIDHEARCFKMLDVKSTSSPLEHFHLSVEKYKYYRQMSFYLQACHQIVPPGYT
ncbi:PD-(D/E)XK nuclease family protein, partial [Arthrospira platensis SPKY1]|nr:PD-(D/E)XK nuclease family protein [Arthrospira platensis SPKY1]